MANLTDAPVVRWRGKASTSTTKTPGENGRNQFIPSKVGGDRFIPTRNSQQMEVAGFLLSKAHALAKEDTLTGAQKTWSTMVHGYDIEQAKILHLSGKPHTPSYQNNLKVLHSLVPAVVSAKTRYVYSMPDRILDAPDVYDDFYLNLMDWGSQNILAVALSNAVYLWGAATGSIVCLLKMKPEDYVSSMSWSPDGTFLAIGTSDCKVEDSEDMTGRVGSGNGLRLDTNIGPCGTWGLNVIWDVEFQKCLRSMASHTARVGSLCWNSHILSSGSRSGHIHHHDVSQVNHHIATLRGHRQEVCGLKWSPSGRFLASGGNDNLVFVWPGMQEGSIHMQAPVQTFRDHQGAVKALAWCPWQPNTLASGGGTSDQHIRIWNASSGSCLSMLDTHSQISSLLFAPNYKELVSSHGFPDDITIWKYPTFDKVGMLVGHESRVLNTALSPDGSMIASLAADNTVRLWNCFQKDPVKKPLQPPGITYQPLR